MSLRIITFMIAVGLAMVALLLSIICVSTDSWISFDIDDFFFVSGKGELGLWRICGEAGSQRECDDLNEDSVRKNIPWLNAVRSFSILSIIMILLTIGLAVVAYIKEPFLFAIGPTGSTILQALMMMIALSIFADKFNDLYSRDLFNYSWSFALGWIGVALYLLSAAMFSVRAIIILKNTGKFSGYKSFK